MDKLRKVFSPGHEQDDEVLYGDSPNPHSTDPRGKLTGPGSHFGQAKEESTFTQPSGNDTTTTTTSSTLAPSLVKPDDGESTASIKSGVQGYPQSSSGLTGAPGIDTTTGAGGAVPGSETTSKSTYDERDTGVADVGDTTTARSYPVGGSAKTGIEGESNFTDDRGTALQTEQSEHHYGRDAGVAGGTAALGAGAYGATRDRTVDSGAGAPPTDPDTTTTESASYRPRQEGVAGAGSGIGSEGRGQPSYSGTTSQQYSRAPGGSSEGYTNPYAKDTIDPRVDSSGTKMPGSFEGEDFGRSSGRPADFKEAPADYGRERPPTPPPKDTHYGRDAGVAAAGIGAVGTGAYEANKLRKEREAEPDSLHGQPAGETRDTAGDRGLNLQDDGIKRVDRSSHPTETSAGRATTEDEPDRKPSGLKGFLSKFKSDKSEDKEAESGDHSHKKEAALGSAGVAGAGAAAYTAGQHGNEAEPSSKYEPSSTTGSASAYDKPGYDQPSIESEKLAGPETATSRTETADTPMDTSRGGAATAAATQEADVRHAPTGYGRDSGYTPMDTSRGGAATAAVTQEADVHHAPTGYGQDSGYTSTQPSQYERGTSGGYDEGPHTGTKVAAGIGAVGAAGAAAYGAEKFDTEDKYDFSPPAGTTTSTATNQPFPERDDDFTKTQTGTTGVERDTVPARYEREETLPIRTAPETTAAPKEPEAPLPARYEREELGATSTAPETTATRREPETLRRDPEEGRHHYGRDAGLAAAGAGAGVYGAHEYSQHREEEAARERARQEEEQRKQMERERHAQEKAAKKEQKEHEKELAHQQKEHEKEIEREKKAAQKAAEKEEKKHEKEVAAAAAAEEKERKKEEHRREKEEAAALAAQQKEQHKMREEEERLRMEEERKRAEPVLEEEDPEKKKSHGLFAMFHRKSRDEREEEKTLEREKPEDSHKKEAALGAAGIGAAGAGAYEYGKHHDEDRVVPTDSMTGEPTDKATGLPEKDSSLGAPETTASHEQTQQETPSTVRDLPTTTHEATTTRGTEPTATGGDGTTTTAPAHTHDAAATGGSATGHRYTDADTSAGAGKNIVIEPHTGLPMDLSKGSGFGGTDGGPFSFQTHEQP